MKAAQCLIMNVELERLLRNNSKWIPVQIKQNQIGSNSGDNVNDGNESEQKMNEIVSKQKRNGDGTQSTDNNLDINSIPIIFGVDSNSIPFKIETDRFDTVLPEEGMKSGVYQLMVTSRLNHDHLHHPITRKTVWRPVCKGDDLYVGGINVGKAPSKDSKRKKKNRKKKKQKDEFVNGDGFGQLVNGTSTVLENQAEDVQNGKTVDSTQKDNESSNNSNSIESSDLDWEITMKWRSVYSMVNRNNECKEPEFTNRINTFSGTLDYLFISNACKVQSFLEMPWQRHLTYHKLLKSNDKEDHADDGDDSDNVTKDDESANWIQLELEKQKRICDSFPYLPNKDAPSDHLPLCADILI